MNFSEIPPLWRTLYTVLGIGLMIFSIIAGITLGLDAHWEAFKEFNPDLWKAMYRNFHPEFWKQLYAILSP